jgi:alanine racemase
VGYGGTWTAPRDSVIATLPIGYADGWARAYAAGWGIVRGARVPLVGRVSSDAIAVDVTDVTGWRGNDEVILLGAEGPAMTAHDLAGLRGSIAWEVIDALAARLPRIYTEGGVPVAARYPDGRTRVAWASPPGPTAGRR